MEQEESEQEEKPALSEEPDANENMNNVSQTISVVNKPEETPTQQSELANSVDNELLLKLN